MSAAGILGRPRGRPLQGPGLLVFVTAIAAAVGVAVAVNAPIAIGVVFLALCVALAILAPGLITPAAIALLVANVPGVLVDAGAPAVLAAVSILLFAVPVLVHVWKGEKLIANWVLVILVALLAVEIVSTLNSRYEDVALGELQTFVFEGMLLYFLAVNAIRTPQALRRALWVILLATSFLALCTVVQAATGTVWRSYGGFALPDPSFAIGKSEEFRASGPLGDPNYYGQVLLVGLCIALVFARREANTLLRLIALGAAGFMGYSILLTYSRGTMVATGLVLLIMACLRYFRAWHVMVLILALIVTFIAVPSYADRLASVSSVTTATDETGTDPEADQSTPSRATEMRAAANVFFDHPLAGVGPGAFPQYYQEYAQAIEGGQVHEEEQGDDEKKGEEAQREAHNLVLSQLAELGLGGASLFFFAIGVTFAGLIRARRRLRLAGRSSEMHMATALLLALFGYLACGMLLTLAFERYFWLLMALCATAALLARVPRSSVPPGRSHPPPAADARQPRHV
jgi:putative inorganic carbon (hco3(-)) transporter